MASLCKICKSDINVPSVSGSVCISEKGAEGINNASVARGDNIVVEKGDRVHVSCRSKYINKKYIEAEQKKKIANIASNSTQSSGKKRTRRSLSADSITSAELSCFFCDNQIQVDEYGGLVDSSAVQTNGRGSFTHTIDRVAKDRADDWGQRIAGKIEYYMKDLHAYDIKYHHLCSTNFRTSKGIPAKYRPDIDPNEGSAAKRQNVGRPIDTTAENAFLELCRFFKTTTTNNLP